VGPDGVGFESCTAFAAETIDPKNIPRAVVVSLIIQGLIAYTFEFARVSTGVGWRKVTDERRRLASMIITTLLSPIEEPFR